MVSSEVVALDQSVTAALSMEHGLQSADRKVLKFWLTSSKGRYNDGRAIWPGSFLLARFCLRKLQVWRSSERF